MGRGGKSFAKNSRFVIGGRHDISLRLACSLVVYLNVGICFEDSVSTLSHLLMVLSYLLMVLSHLLMVLSLLLMVLSLLLMVDDVHLESLVDGPCQ